MPKKKKNNHVQQKTVVTYNKPVQDMKEIEAKYKSYLDAIIIKITELNKIKHDMVRLEERVNKIEFELSNLKG